MILVGLALPALVAALLLSWRVGPGTRRQAAVGAAGLAAVGIATVVALVTDCPGCTPEIGPWLAAIAAAGWLVGLAITLAARRRLARRRLGVTPVAVGVALLLLVTVVVASGRRALELVWLGCPTNEELQRVQSVEEVVAAFAWYGPPLEPIPLPAWLPPREPAYRGARAFRYRRPDATAYVLVCRQRCHVSRSRFAEARRVEEQRWWMGLDSNNNVPIWITDARPGAGERLLRELEEPRARVQPYIRSGSRCYIR